MDKEKVYVIGIFFLTLTTGITATFIDPLKWWDESVYANLGYDLSKNPLDYSFKNWGDKSLGADWDKAGFRAPLLPYTISLFYISGLEVMIRFIVPVISAIGVIIVYLIGKELFNKRLALYASLFLAFLPVYAFFSGKILADILATMLMSISFLFFWKGFVNNNNKYKYLTGFVTALAILAKYTAMILLPVYIVFFLAMKKHRRHILEKETWLAFAIFLLALTPLFLYSIHEYGNPLRLFFHATDAASFWGGDQSITFLLTEPLYMFSVMILLGIAGIIIIIKNKILLQPRNFILVIWILFVILSIAMFPHKESRYALMLTPPLVLLGAVSMDAAKRYKQVIPIAVVIVLAASTLSLFYYERLKAENEGSRCFLESMEKLNKEINEDSKAIIFTDQSAKVYFYTHAPTHFAFNITQLSETEYKNRTVYMFWYYEDEEPIIDISFSLIFSCPSTGTVKAKIFVKEQNA